MGTLVVKHDFLPRIEALRKNCIEENYIKRLPIQEEAFNIPPLGGLHTFSMPYA